MNIQVYNIFVVQPSEAEDKFICKIRTFIDLRLHQRKEVFKPHKNKRNLAYITTGTTVKNFLVGVNCCPQSICSHCVWVLAFPCSGVPQGVPLVTCSMK